MRSIPDTTIIIIPFKCRVRDISKYFTYTTLHSKNYKRIFRDRKFMGKAICSILSIGKREARVCNWSYISPPTKELRRLVHSRTRMRVIGAERAIPWSDVERGAQFAVNWRINFIVTRCTVQRPGPSHTISVGRIRYGLPHFTRATLNRTPVCSRPVKIIKDLSHVESDTLGEIDYKIVSRPHN